MSKLLQYFVVVEEAVNEGKSLQFENSTVNVNHHVMMSPATVSYTHLRAHETLMNLVCRLLLEKKK